ncbi:MAG: carbohydrate-binding domain-containing protein [Lachnospiraceae bacterium]|nr:carbohydrate-binding domain-containing protein [Candidatus Minthocola equi]
MSKPVKIILISVLSIILVGLVIYCIGFSRQPEENIANTSAKTSEEALAEAARLLNSAATGNASAQNITLSDSGAHSVKISSPGIYKVSGTLSEGQLTVNCNGEVILILDGVEIRNSSGSAILIEDASHTMVYLAEGSNNIIVSGTEQEITGANASTDSATGATLYSRDNLSIGGSGTLSVGGYINNAIATTNHLSVLGGELSLTAVNNGLKGNDSVTVLGGNINMSCGNDGVKSENDISIEDGTITIAGGNAASNQPVDMPARPDDMSIPSDMQKPGNMPNPSDMQQPENVPAQPDMQQPENMPNRPDMQQFGGRPQNEMPDRNQNFFNVANTSKNSKGIVCPGTVNISGGNITIANAFEGIEGRQIYVSGGNLSITASDDGFNANGSYRSADGLSAPILKISGGNVLVNADGDGLDSNGDIIIEGGYVIVDGPSNSANGALDAGTEDGGILAVHGGTVLAIGASGMAESFGDKSTQFSFIKNFSEMLQAGTKITISDSNGNVIFEYSGAKAFNSIVFSSPDLVLGNTYTISAGSLSESVTIDSISSGNSTGGFGRGGFGR